MEILWLLCRSVLKWKVFFVAVFLGGRSDTCYLSSIYYYLLCQNFLRVCWKSMKHLRQTSLCTGTGSMMCVLMEKSLSRRYGAASLIRMELFKEVTYSLFWLRRIFCNMHFWQNNHHVENISAKISALRGKVSDLERAAAQRKAKLDENSAFLQFNWKADVVESWIGTNTFTLLFSHSH